jgi:indolepyruvate ferredoxin oxidoreductase beta subunit
MQIILTGVGGQGILFSTRVIAESAILEGKHVICSETHGMAQRGASVVSHIRIGDFASPRIRIHSADCSICLVSDQLPTSLEFLKENGQCYVNIGKDKNISPDLLEYAGAKNIKISSVDADNVAMRLEFLRGANLVIIGYASAIQRDFPCKENIITTIKNISKKDIAQKNIGAFLFGYELATKKNL